MKLAIIGAGLSGLTLAQRLRPKFDVTVFEKSRAVGGRMSTRRKDGFSFDHGAQYFSAKSDAFQEFLAPYIKEGAVATWSPRLVNIDIDGNQSSIIWDRPRYVGAPYMRALCEAMSNEIEVKLAVEISDLSRLESKWQLTDKEGQSHGPFDWVITTTPSVQAERLLPPDCTYLSALSEAEMKGCYSLMLGLEDNVNLGWDAALIENGPVAWVSINSTKPGRSTGISPDKLSIVAQSSNDWANARMDDDQDAIKQEMLQNLEQIIGQKLPKIAYEELHRWRFANVKTSAGQDVLIDEDQQLASCGDWCMSGKIESAFLSAINLSEHLL